MSTASEEILARYKKVEREADSFGRLIGVKRLNPSQQLKIMEMSNSDNEGVRTALFAAASVCEIDDLPVTFAKSRAELDSIIARLDQEGLEAVGKALNRLLGGDEAKSGEEVEHAAKKSRGTR
jgi:hypothetical protein